MPSDVLNVLRVFFLFVFFFESFLLFGMLIFIFFLRKLMGGIAGFISYHVERVQHFNWVLEYFLTYLYLLKSQVGVERWFGG